MDSINLPDGTTVPKSLLICDIPPKKIGGKFPSKGKVWYLHWKCDYCEAEFRTISSLVDLEIERSEAITKIKCPFCCYYAKGKKEKKFAFSSKIDGPVIAQLDHFKYDDTVSKEPCCHKCKTEMKPNWIVCPTCGNFVIT